MLKIYSKFLKNNEEDYKKINLNTKDLFAYYIERIKLKGKDENNIKDIIQKIKKFMTDLISEWAYIEDLIEMLSEIKQTNELKNIFYEIIVNLMEIMNEEGLSKKKEEKYSRYYAKLYFEREYYILKK